MEGLFPALDLQLKMQRQRFWKLNFIMQMNKAAKCCNSQVSNMKPHAHSRVYTTIYVCEAASSKKLSQL